MPRFFITESDIKETDGGIYVRITGEDAAHITKALRMRVGEILTVCDMKGIEYETRITETGESVFAEVVSSKKSENEPPYKCAVYQSLVKGDRFDTVLQKSTELGASDIIPVITSRCTVKLEKSDYARKTERWQKIVNEASKQCGRAAIPTVHLPLSFRDAVEEAKKSDLSLFCYEGDGTKPLSYYINEEKAPKSVSVMIGPEGGYSVDEAEYASMSGMKMTGLGKRILRTETAPIYVLSCISMSYELSRGFNQD